MKSFSIIVPSMLLSVSNASASVGMGVERLGFMTLFFFAFGILIVLYQFTPGLMLIGRLLKEMFSSIDVKVSDAGTKKSSIQQ
ncbi:MAG: hypothetical protein M0023_01240 [Desulfobacteraceae bacterium]|nr:hypothetical protein [Desulfobacteraceae bacterium]